MVKYKSKIKIKHNIDLKSPKTIIIISIVATALLLLFAWYNREEWSAHKRCADCEALETEKLQKLAGTIELKNSKTIFTHQFTGLKYELIPCDLKCDNNLNQWFDKIGFTDERNQPILFQVEGSFDAPHKTFVYTSAILLGERTFVDIKKIKGWSFEEISEKYTAVKEETFPLNEASVSEFRLSLYNHFDHKERLQKTPIKEATWETSDSTLVTIWFIQKQNQWQPIEHYEWTKDTEF